MVNSDINEKNARQTEQFTRANALRKTRDEGQFQG